MALLSMVAMGRIAVQGHVISSSGVSRPVWNVWTYESTGGAGYTVTVKTALATSFRNLVWNKIRPVLHTDYVGDRIWVWLPSITGDTSTATIVPGNGTRTGNRLPINQAVYCRLDTGLRGRWYIGSKRLAPLSESDVVSDELTVAAQANWQTAVNWFTASPATGAGGTFVQWNPVVWSRVLSTAPPDLNPQVGADIISATPYFTVSSWRHRRERTQR
jgi:hypothetical protein